MFNRELERRIKYLEDAVNKMLQKERCANGQHVWETVESSFHDSLPFIRCRECWKSPDE